MPSSQVSPASRRRLPQISRKQVELQPSPLALLPSSHCSTPSLVPLPQAVSITQVLLQPSPLALLPSSHCSAASTRPSPHFSIVQSERQPSPPTKLPSSH